MELEKLIPNFTSREDYYQVIKPRRVKNLSGLIKEHKPRIIIGYGKSLWMDYRELIEGSEFNKNG